MRFWVVYAVFCINLKVSLLVDDARDLWEAVESSANALLARHLAEQNSAGTWPDVATTRWYSTWFPPVQSMSSSVACV